MAAVDQAADHDHQREPAFARRSAAPKYLAEQVTKHFFGDGADQVGGYVPPKS
jgi:Fe-S cluster biosynthesis and repair protein YggX